MAGTLQEPGPVASDDMRCVAIAGPRVLSRQQQDLVCLRAGHVDCPRYRTASAPSSPARGPGRALAIPRAILVSLIWLGLSAILSFGFVMARGGIDLPLPSASATALAASVSPSPATPSATTAAAPSPVASPVGTPAPAASPSLTPAPTEPPATMPPSGPSAAPTPAPSASASSGVPSASRLAVLKPCPAQSGCYLYTVRSGDNLYSIAHWFGVPLATVYALNPTVKGGGIQAGMVLKLPTPTR